MKLKIGDLLYYKSEDGAGDELGMVIARHPLEWKNKSDPRWLYTIKWKNSLTDYYSNSMLLLHYRHDYKALRNSMRRKQA